MKKLLLAAMTATLLVTGCASTTVKEPTPTTTDDQTVQLFSKRAVDAWNSMTAVEQYNMCSGYERDPGGTIEAFFDGFGHNTPDSDIALKVFLALLEVNC